MISVNEAHKIILNSIPEPIIELVSFNQSNKRILADVVKASFNQPLFNNSAMDGFAVISEDIKNVSETKPILLQSVATIAAGDDVSNISITRGQCTQIMTGAEIPKGADAVVMVEQTSGFEKIDVSFFSPAKIGQNIRKVGEEIKQGVELIRKGTEIGPSEIGTFATFGFSKVSVFKQPKIAIFGLGDELKEPGETLQPGQIYNSNLHVLKELVQKVGGKVMFSVVVKDDKKAMELFMEEALDKVDILISSGGISMGKFDFIKPVMQSLGVREQFWKVAQKPGKPLFFGTQKDKLIFGLPGNPISSYMCFMEYVYPTIKLFQNATISPKIEVELASEFPVEQKKHRFLFGDVKIEDDKLICSPSKKHGSHMLTSSLGANCILEANAGNRNIKKGEKVKVQLLPWERLV